MATHTLTTQGIKYAGSKLKLLPYITDIMHSLKPHSVLDGFSGTTRVSQALAQSGYHVTSNDVAIWSYHFAQCYLKANKPTAYYQSIINHLNALTPKNGWFSEHYGAAVNELQKAMANP
jgi:adenine-specific DNA-methyltransferase